ncbi:hypothetical protein CAPTEDRAFT_224786 [Capitella teleta]|uniref:protein acetyllysine N-acetyltransferase n=1 Tax=Capitella teleta TaxID=283909 RepID=R7TRL9_CAPTE|nr:hypothetical protein CAPTEDRAFT_224786 [Capitella teleta]|eukprot:ELT93675.1 hypothetical protein CAPTEDRAFT_224786 [Capitella teleta]
MEETLVCSLKKCIQEKFTKRMPRVEVKSVDLPLDDRSHMMVNWAEDGQATFHDICWKALINSFKMDNPFTLCSREKELVQEARKSSEYFDSWEKVKFEADRVTRMMKDSQYAIAFTGAGISTAAGIYDFRGKNGKWTERDREKYFGPSQYRRHRDFCYEELRPTYTHEAILKLLQLGYIKHVISQNTDGLHRLSGIPRDKLSELHGNSFHEKCEKCQTRYERPFAVKKVGDSPPRICVHCHFDHRTGRNCERKGCDGPLMNTIINFGDSLEKRVLSIADEHAKRNDLVLCLGTTLRVTPACDLVEAGVRPLRLVICNRQPTSFDRMCYEVAEGASIHSGARVYGDCDHFMREIMTSLLSAEDLEEWEDEVEGKEYSRQRERPPE